LENLHELEEEEKGHADGKIPHANSSNYNSHQSHGQHAFASRRNEAFQYNTAGTNALEETYIINNVVLRKELRESKVLNQTSVSLSSDDRSSSSSSERTLSQGGALAPWSNGHHLQPLKGHMSTQVLAFAKGSAPQTISGGVMSGKTSVQR